MGLWNGRRRIRNRAEALAFENAEWDRRVQKGAAILVAGNVVPALGMYVLHWDPYYFLLLILSEALIMLVRDYVIIIRNIEADGFEEKIVPGLQLLLIYGFMTSFVLFIGLGIITDTFGPEEVKQQFKEVPRGIVGIDALFVALLFFFIEQVWPMWLAVLLVVWNEVKSHSLARKRALRERKSFQSRPHFVFRWPILFFVLIACVQATGNAHYGLWLFLAVKCLVDLLGYAIDIWLDGYSEEG